MGNLEYLIHLTCTIELQENKYQEHVKSTVNNPSQT